MPKAKILKAENLSPTVKLYRLRALEELGFHFTPGQFFTLLPARRAYSFCSLPEELPRFEICVRQVPWGLGTNYINDHLGKVVEVSEPQGSFILPKAPVELIFLAAGVGIAPVRPMLKDWYQKYPTARTTLYYKFREGEYLFGEEFEELARKHKNFEIEKADHPLFLSPLRRGRKNGGVFVVGSPEFVSESIRKLEKIGYNKADINFDIW